MATELMGKVCWRCLRPCATALALVGRASGRASRCIPRDLLRVFRRQHHQDRAGGWVPLAIGGGVFLLMSTWSRGTDLLRRFLAQVAVPMDRFLDEVERTKPPRVRGTAVFLTHDVDGAPLVLQRHLLYNEALHEKIILLSIITKEVPEVEHDQRVTTEALPQGFHRVRAYYGFMERP